MASASPVVVPPVMPPFPRSVSTYVGRVAELARVADMLARETLFLVYGVGGIGKSELVYRAIEVARRHPQWEGSEPLLVSVRAGFTVAHVLAQLRLGLGLRVAPAELTQAGPSLDDELAEIAHALAARPSLVFLDDLHHLPVDSAARMLAYLSRHVQRSRLFVASRLELPLPPDIPAPVILRLSPLDRDDTAAMVAGLGRRLGLAELDPGEVFERSGGSPFFVQRLLVGEAGEAESSLDQSLTELPPPLHHRLLMLALLRTRISLAELIADPEDAAAEGEIRALAGRFLVDVDRDAVLVHDLVRDALTRPERPAERAAAHRAAAHLYQRRYRAQPRRAGLDALEASYHLLRAGDLAQAWTFAESSYPAIAAAGLDHLLIDLLAELRAALDDQRLAIDLLRARILVRRSLIAEAAEILAPIELADGDAWAFRYLMLAGTVAHHRGRLERAEGLFERARANAADPAEALSAVLQLSYVLALRGHHERARAEVDAAFERLPSAGVRERGRRDWIVAVNYILGERFEEGVATAAGARAALAGHGADDLELLLAMLEVLGRAECNEAKMARRVFDEVLSRAGDAGRLRAPVVSVYRGVVLYSEGAVRAAHDALVDSIAYLDAHADHVMAVFARYYLCRTLVALGRAGEAVSLAAESAEIAAEAGLRALVCNGTAARADALVACGRMRESMAQAREVLAGTEARANSRWLAAAALMRCLSLQGDIDGAREVCREFEATVARASYRLAIALERCTVELLGGDLNLAVALAEEAWHGYAADGRRWLEARAAATLSLALVARGRATDLAAVEAPLARAETLGRPDYPLVAAAAALARAALWARTGDRARGIDHLMATARAIAATDDSPQVALLRAGLEPDAPIAAGVRSLADRLGLSAGRRYRALDRTRVRIATDADLARLRGRYELVVEPARAVITAGGTSESGRPLTCELLARLIEAQGRTVAAAELFRDVWGGREYHPLRHRNTVYVAVKRLRKTLRGLLGERAVIETASGGWRIADGLDAASIRPVGDQPES
ncbi:AAA family ATPase [Haliangium sp.]|uniref:AAA family ATPase n=1 Tax=Haliangium sp. TaxID=2663208 RepID=UPI003D0C35E6